MESTEKTPQPEELDSWDKRKEEWAAKLTVQDFEKLTLEERVKLAVCQHILENMPVATLPSRSFLISSSAALCVDSGQLRKTLPKNLRTLGRAGSR
jgi:hypothetical protein